VIPLSLHILPPPHTSPLFPYTTLFRSHTVRRGQTEVHRYKLSRTRYSVGDREGRYRLPRKNVCVGRAADAVRPQSKNWGPLTRRSEEHTSELQSRENLVCRLLLEKKKK